MSQIKEVTIQGVAGQCPVCQHPPIRHEPDGTGTTCMVCAWLATNDIREGRRARHVCTLEFTFKLSRSEREQAAKSEKSTFPPKTVCAECDTTWEAHMGMLCPTGDSTFLPLLDKDKPFLYVH